MIFGLQYALVAAGWSAFNFWLGNYMVEYTGATSEQLGVFFVIHPITYLLKPVICSIADRHHAHKQLFIACLFSVSLAYLPFAVLPFFINQTEAHTQSRDTNLVAFWCLVALHFVGAASFCGVRSLGDVMTVNYAQRVHSDFGHYRCFGSIAIGVCSVLISYVNVGWILPDYVTGILVFMGCHFILAFIVRAWPDEYFVILSQSQLVDEFLMSQRPQLPNTRDSWRTVAGNLCVCTSQSANSKAASSQSQLAQIKHLSPGQQLKIFFLLARIDLRIPMMMSLLILMGLTGYSGQHFVQVALKEDCAQLDPSSGMARCNSSNISGTLILLMSLGELIVLYLYNKLQMADLTRLQIHLTISIVQYLSLYFLTNISPYFYLINSLHGLESVVISILSVQTGRSLADGVELILDDLRDKSIVGDKDDIEVVKVSLAATMIALLIMCYEGIGATIGRLSLGFFIGKFGFKSAWLLIASVALVFFLLVTVMKCLERVLKFNSKLTERIARHSSNKG